VSYDDNAAGAFITSTGGAVPEDIAGLYGDDTGTRYIVTRDGRHFFEGATLPNGLTIASIGPDRVVFQRNGAQYIVKIGNGPEGPGAAAAPDKAANATKAGASGATATGNPANAGMNATTGNATGSAATGAPAAPPATQTPHASSAPGASNMVNAAGALEARARPASAPPHS
jgi:hypothetical protein